MSFVNNNSEAGHLKENLKALLQPYFSFRLYIQFKFNKEYADKSRTLRRHFYGNEHTCTYKQCLAGKVPYIELDRMRGYTELCKLVERGEFRGNYIVAKIFGISPETGDFDILHRTYLKGKLDKLNVNDPIFDTSEQIIRLYYHVQNNRVLVLPPGQLAPDNKAATICLPPAPAAFMPISGKCAELPVFGLKPFHAGVAKK